MSPGPEVRSNDKKRPRAPTHQIEKSLEKVMANEKAQNEVDQLLSQVDEKTKSSLKSIECFKEVEPVIDVGNLLLIDQEPLAAIKLR